MTHQYLTASELDDVVDAAAAAGLINDAARTVLLGSLNQGFVLGSLPIIGFPLLQLRADLNAMNTVERLADGSVPLRDWLRQAGTLARQMGRTQASVFTAYETKVDAVASGQPPLPDPATMPEIINKEDIVYQDDMVDFSFLAAGDNVGRAVAKLLVPKYQGGAPVLQSGAPVRHAGTGWLIKKDLLVTNHHVVNARKTGESAASESDLLLQAMNAVVKFDYNSVDDEGTPATVTALEAWDENLDYAILHLAAPAACDPPRLFKQAVVFSSGSYVPLNIIQHPAGHPKRVAFRNNLLTAADATTIRYFTDTLSGSSGAPVFDDAWHVIALHRGSVPVSNVSFQGQSVAVVNIGTQIAAILDHLAAHYLALYQEITA